MKLSPDELSELLRDANTDAKEIAALRERVLKLEHKVNELCDVLVDLIMGKYPEQKIQRVEEVNVTNGTENSNDNI